MKNYELSQDEFMLYKGNVVFVGEKDQTQLIVTSLNIVFITTHKKILAKDEVVVESFPINEIKIYKNVPQLRVNGNIVEIYLLTTDKEVEFAEKSELKEFVKVVNELLTQKTKAERCAEKVKKAIQLIDDTLGVNTVESVSHAIKDGKAVSVGKSIVGVGIKAIGGVFKRGKNKEQDKNEPKKVEVLEIVESTENKVDETESNE